MVGWGAPPVQECAPHYRVLMRCSLPRLPLIDLRSLCERLCRCSPSPPLASPALPPPSPLPLMRAGTYPPLRALSVRFDSPRLVPAGYVGKEEPKQ